MSKQPHSNEKSVKTSIRDEAKLAESGKKNEREKDISRPKRDDSKQLLQSEASSTTKKTDVDAAVASPRAADVRSSKQTSFKIPKIVKSSDKATSASTDVAKNKPAEEAGQKNSQSLPAKCPPTEARNKSLEMPMNDVQNVVQSTSDRLKQSSSKIESVRRLFGALWCRWRTVNRESPFLFLVAVAVVKRTFLTDGTDGGICQDKSKRLHLPFRRRRRRHIFGVVTDVNLANVGLFTIAWPFCVLFNVFFDRRFVNDEFCKF